MARLSLVLLGAFQARLDGQLLTGFESDKARALLTYLAMEADRPHNRAQLAGLFWPDWPDAAARGHLRHALANLRQLLGDAVSDRPFLRVTRSTLQFNLDSDSWIDAVQICRSLTTFLSSPGDRTGEDLRQIEHAIAGYHSPFLAGFFLTGCAEFEEWVLLTRERLQRQVLETLRLLTDHFEARGNYSQALAYGQRRVELEPWLEEAHYQLMRLLALSGQRSAALAQYERCRRALVDELGITPSTETTALFERIRTESTGMGAGQQVSRGAPAELRAPLRRGMPPIHPPAPRHKLPAPLTPLVGRTQEMAAIQKLFREEGARLVTLTGAGGVGKTRLALQVAKALLDKHLDGVYFVALAAIREPAMVISAIAQTLDVREVGSRPLLERVQAQLRDGVSLLVLDNFEHVAAAAPVITELLVACPYLNVLCTSRELLHLRGEFEYVVPPLPVPPHPSQIPMDELAAFASVELFRQRAAAVKQGFVLDAASTPMVARLCARLDGLPLAIELAAAQLKRFSLPALGQQLAAAGSVSSLRFLKAGTRDAPDRHRSLWDAIAWSHALLKADEQALFQQLAVFVGGCTPEAVAAVWKHAEGTVLFDCIASLVDKNLVHQEEQADGQVRITMLETLREFALERLRETGELETIQRRHAEYFVTLAEVADSQMTTPNQLVWLNRLEAEHDNLRAAQLWATQQGESELALRLGAALSRFWLRHGHQQEGYVRLTALLQQWQSPKPCSPIEDVLYFAGMFALQLGNIETAHTLFEQSADASRKTGNPYRLSYALALMAHLKHEQGDYAAADALYEEGVQLAHQVEDKFGVAMFLSHHGRMLAERGHLVQGRQFCEQGTALHREIGEKWGAAIAFRNLGVVRRLQGDWVEAQRLFEGMLRLGQEIGDTPTKAQALYDLGCVRMQQGDCTMARAFLYEALHLYNQIGFRARIANTLDALAHVAATERRPTHALHLIAAATALRASVGFVLAPLFQAEADQLLQAIRQALNEEAAATAWVEGETMTLEEVVAYALAT
jgi:predicted ATPase/DNA-binding SARP family transcriptional activator